MMVLGAPVSAVLMRRFGPRRTAVTGMALITAAILVLSRLDRASTAVGIGSGFLLLGAGFGAVMVTATAVIVRHASRESAGVASGLQQTAMNVGPTVGVAVATTMLSYAGAGASGAGVEMGPALTVLAVVSALGTLLGTGLPGRPREEGAARHEPAAEAGSALATPPEPRRRDPRMAPHDRA
jgi:MFS family permease